MRFFLFTLTVLGWTAAASFADESAFLSNYCLKCHGEEKQKGDRRFDGLNQDFSSIETLEAWQEILDQINLGEMPPEKEKQPSAEETKAIVEAITGKLKLAHKTHSADLAKPVIRRLNKVQYDRTVRTYRQSV